MLRLALLTVLAAACASPPDCRGPSSRDAFRRCVVMEASADARAARQAKGLDEDERWLAERQEVVREAFGARGEDLDRAVAREVLRRSEDGR